jgi:ATP-binding cassette subfamily E protein 1
MRRLSGCHAVAVRRLVMRARSPQPSTHPPPPTPALFGQVIKRFILHAKKTAFIVEHDFIMVRTVAKVLYVFVELLFVSSSPPPLATHSSWCVPSLVGLQATYLADAVIVYEGSPGVDCLATAPQSLLTGMNRFLRALDITFRRDPTSFRPRINKVPCCCCACDRVHCRGWWLVTDGVD